MYVSTKRAAYKMNKVCFLTLFVDKCFTNCLSVADTFLQNFLSFKRFSILKENCGADIKNGAFKCNIFVDKCYKTRSLTHTFPQKPRSFKFLIISEENCGADIINGTFKCKTLNFVVQRCKKGSSSGLYFPTKTSFF